MSVRVRFAPSPTGYLHIGGVRTALYTWLWARKNQGTMILRIEDTDQARNTQEAVDIVLESMRWLGLDWDEGPEVGGPHAPYFQGKRLDLYREHAEKLIASGHAFRCYADKDEIAAMRAEYEAKTGKKGFRFRSPWRDRTDGDPSQPHSVRFKAPAEGKTGWDDLVYGRVDYPNAEQQDFVLLRPNGLPLYNFACFVDDMTMGVTLVTRGEDHLINTPQQLLLFDAAGAKRPDYAHLPLINGPDGKKLSKRQASVAALEYRDAGYLPDGLLNYLARLGWSHGDDEIFTREDLIAKFDWKSVGKKASTWDDKKLQHVQGTHLRMLSNEKLAALVSPRLKQRGLDVAPDDARLLAAIEPVKLRATTLDDLADDLDYFFRPDDELTYEEKGSKKFLKPDYAGNLEKLAEIVAKAEPFDEATLEASVNAWMEAESLKMKVVAQPARMALSGRTRSPGLYETIVLIGQESAVKRLRKGATMAKG